MARAIGRLKHKPGQKVGLLSKTLRLTDYRETHNCGYSNPGVDTHNPALEEPGVRQNSIDQDVWPSLYGLTVECEVEALAFDFGRGTKTNDQIDQL
jgi:hypothetical protein